jgi:ribosome-binding protein aMBF1 (putative translation factor)
MIKQAREQVGLSQQAFADRVGAHKRTVQRWESGEMRPRELQIAKIKQVVTFYGDALGDVQGDVTGDALAEQNVGGDVSSFKESHKTEPNEAIPVRGVEEDKDIGIDIDTPRNDV